MGITIKAARINAGLSQKEVAERLGISVHTLYNWEQPGGFKKLRIDKAKQMLDLYGLDFDDIEGSIFMPKSLS